MVEETERSLGISNVAVHRRTAMVVAHPGIDREVDRNRDQEDPGNGPEFGEVFCKFLSRPMKFNKISTFRI